MSKITTKTPGEPVTIWAADLSCRFLTLEVGRPFRSKFFEYELDEIMTDGSGRAVEWKKPDGTVYTAYVAADGSGSSCTCPAGQFGKACKHTAITRELWATGRMPVPESLAPWNQDADVQSDPVHCEVCGAPVDDPFECMCPDCKPVASIDQLPCWMF